MHEMSICEALLQQVTQIVKQQQAQAAECIIVKIGALSGVEPHLLERAFSVARIGTVAEQAELQLQQSPITLRCRECGQESTTEQSNRLLCGHCGSWQTQLVSGDELILARVEMRMTK